MFAILFEVLLIEIQEEILHFAGWEGGGLRGAKIVNKNLVNKLAFPKQETLGDKVQGPSWGRNKKNDENTHFRHLLDARFE